MIKHQLMYYIICSKAIWQGAYQEHLPGADRPVDLPFFPYKEKLAIYALKITYPFL